MFCFSFLLSSSQNHSMMLHWAQCTVGMSFSTECVSAITEMIVVTSANGLVGVTVMCPVRLWVYMCINKLVYNQQPHLLCVFNVCNWL